MSLNLNNIIEIQQIQTILSSHPLLLKFFNSILDIKNIDINANSDSSDSSESDSDSDSSVDLDDIY
tara:strand:- start:133 stop:330 length:198 start_codon:yes stop_codon:yes gene_type:complete